MKANAIVVAGFLVLGVAAHTSGQVTPIPLDPRAQPPAKALVPLEVEVVIARYDGAKRISSIPYTLAINANGTEVQLNMGTDVAVPSTAFAPVANPETKAQPLVSYNYRSVGTQIQARATTTDDGRFDVRLDIDDSSVYTNPTPAGSGIQGLPAFRNFRSRNTLLLRDGQMREYTAATDRVSGEVVKVSVTLRVVK
jgi:hypothetical protein